MQPSPVSPVAHTDDIPSVRALAIVRDMYQGKRAAQLMSTLMTVMAVAPLIVGINTNLPARWSRGCLTATVNVGEIEWRHGYPYMFGIVFARCRDWTLTAVRHV